MGMCSVDNKLIFFSNLSDIFEIWILMLYLESPWKKCIQASEKKVSIGPIVLEIAPSNFERYFQIAIFL